MFKQAPLPFVGQKRMFLKHFKTILNEHIDNDGAGWTIVDIFGGSGLLSHVAKRLKPQARVIFNDFDNYADRLVHIDDINRLRHLIADLLVDVPRDTLVPDDIKHQIIDVIQSFPGYIDLRTLSTWLLFSGRQVRSFEQLFKSPFWHCMRQTDYEAFGYLDGLEIICDSFQQLLPKFAGQPKTLLILDPPYLYTQQDAYKQDDKFQLLDFCRLVDQLKPPYIFFSSTKSEFINYINWLVETKQSNWQSFDNAKRIVVKATINHNRQYEDNLVYKF